jgi:hypothetical protein
VAGEGSGCRPGRCNASGARFSRRGPGSSNFPPGGNILASPRKPLSIRFAPRARLDVGRPSPFEGVFAPVRYPHVTHGSPSSRAIAGIADVSEARASDDISEARGFRDMTFR